MNKNVINAMLAVQRYPWEQGVCMQAMYEYGDINTAVAMAHDAVLRQANDGRLAITGYNIAVTDPAANGEMVWRAFLHTGDVFYKNSAEKMLKYLLEAAPRTDKGILCHNEVSFHEGFSPKQIWVDSIYMAPPFLAVMGEIDEAKNQLLGMYAYLINTNKGLLNHIYDAGNKCFVREELWATGNGWALLGIARVIDEALLKNRCDIAQELMALYENLLKNLLPYQLVDGRFHDVLDNEDSFVEGTAAMMMAASIYRGVKKGWLDSYYLKFADVVSETMEKYVDEFGIIHEVCGCPDFMSMGTSAESMASYIMMWAWKNKL